VPTLASNLGATQVTWRPELEQELAPLRENADAYWERRSALPWT
jgi:hypothetical protein